MPDKQPSPIAMRAAEEIGLSVEEIIRSMFGPDLEIPFSLQEMKEKYATIIDREMEPKWINCSERMPTRGDANREGMVMWGVYGGIEGSCNSAFPLIGPDNLFDSPEDALSTERITHWARFPKDPEPEDATK